MLRITLNRSAESAVKYFDEGLSKSDYYSMDDKISGKWHGKGAKLLGLEGDVSRREFSELAHNIHPQTKETLTARNDKNRRVGYDFTFSVPKSVSILHSLTDDKEILEAFDRSVKATMIEIEKDAEVRVRKNGQSTNRNSGNLIWANFTHEEARPVNGLPDPHLHQHVFCFNMSHDKVEDKWKAVDVSDVNSNAPYFQAMFHANLAYELKQVGYDVEKDKNNFQVQGFGRSLIEKFSSRTKQVNDKAKKLEGLTEKQKSELGAKTRANKRKGYTLGELKMQWKSRLSESEKVLISNAKNSSGGFFSDSFFRKGEADKAIDYSVEHNFERKSVATKKELLLHALKKGLGKFNFDQLNSRFNKNKTLLRGKDGSNRSVYTTQEALDEENSLIKEARKGKNTLDAINDEYEPQNTLLTKEQSGAITHALNSKDFITVIAGKAGTGKTWSIKEIRDGAEQAGIKFNAFAPSSSASRQVQREEGFQNATTVAELIMSKKKQDEQKNGMIWIDEAGLLGNHDMNKVIEIAKNQNARLLLSGDVKQHSAVKRGDALRVVQDFGGIKPYYLTDIKRQKTKEYKNAVKYISEGDFKKGIEKLDKMGAIKEHDDFGSLREAASNEYVESIKKREDVLLVAVTHNQGRQLTESIREKLKEAKILGKETMKREVLENLPLAEAEKKDFETYQPGMKVGFHQNGKGGLMRGSTYTVDAVMDKEIIVANNKGEMKPLPLKEAKKFSVYQTKELELTKGDKIKITQNSSSEDKKRVSNGNVFEIQKFLENGDILAKKGRGKVILGKDFQHMSYGYYTTSPSSQGKTADKVIIAQGAGSGKAANAEQFYVSASRGKFGISVHTEGDHFRRSAYSAKPKQEKLNTMRKRSQTNRKILTQLLARNRGLITSKWLRR